MSNADCIRSPEAWTTATTAVSTPRTSSPARSRTRASTSSALPRALRSTVRTGSPSCRSSTCTLTTTRNGMPSCRSSPSRCGEREARTSRSSGAPDASRGAPGAPPLDELVLTEEQPDLAGRALGAVGAVHDVLLLAQREVAADGARRGLRRVGVAHHGARHGDGLAALPHHGHDRAGGDERGQRLEERLADVLGVVPLG